MSRLWQLVRKDLLVLFREPSALGMILLIPLLIATVFGAVNSGGESSSRMKIYLVDEDGTTVSARFAGRLAASDDLDVSSVGREEALDGLRLGKRVAAIVILPDFGARLSRFPLSPEAATVELLSDPKRGQAAGMMTGTAMRAAIDIIEARMAGNTPVGGASPGLSPIAVITKPFELKSAVPVNAFEITIPQAALWSILSAVAIMSGGLAIERSQQTLLRLRVSPMPPTVILGSKIVSCVLTIIMSVALIMLVGVVVFGVHVTNLLLLIAATVLSGFCFAGIMLAIGSLGRNPGSVTGTAWGIMVLFAMLGGGMIPQFLMPEWLQTVGSISPGKWAVVAMEGAIWRNFSFIESLPSYAILLSVGLLGTTVGVSRLGRTEFS